VFTKFLVKGKSMNSRTLRTIQVVFLSLLLVSFVGCDFSTSVDYDMDADFAGLKTYAWAEQEHAEISELMQRRIVQAVDEQLQAKGFSQADSNPDVYVTYHGDDNEQYVLDTTNYGYGFGPSWYWGGGMSTSTTQVRSYREGTLIVDMYSAAQKQLIWRGTVTATLDDNPQQVAKDISKGVQKLFKKYPPQKKS